MAKDRPRALPRNRALPLALGLLCAGTALGAVVGVVQKRVLPAMAAPRVTAAPPYTTPAAQGKPVRSALGPAAADVVQPQPAATRTQGAPAVRVRNVADVERELVSARPAPAMAHQQPTIADLQEKPPPPVLEPRSTSVVVGAPPHVQAQSKQTGETQVRFSVGDAEVARAFALAHPARIVVDFARANLPKVPLLLDKDGVHRVRFGEPTHGHPRAVLELTVDSKPAQVEARVSDGTLVVTYH